MVSFRYCEYLPQSLGTLSIGETPKKVECSRVYFIYFQFGMKNYFKSLFAILFGILFRVLLRIRVLLGH